MDIEKAKKVFEKYINGKDTMKETLVRAIEVLLNELNKKEKIINELLTEITAVNSGRYEYMDNKEVLEIFTKKVRINKMVSTKNRKKELNKVKEIIKENFKFGNCGLYDTRNLVGDSMATIFNGDYFQIDICYYYSYFEVFGTTDEEFDTLYKYYNKLRED